MDKELWLQCIEWLVSTGVLDPNAVARITKPADLASLLMDGVLLCELVLKFCPDCIDRNEMFLHYEENRKSLFMRAKNISLFLDVCRSHFGLSELFDGNDLYDLDDFGRVLRVLSHLSHSQQAKNFNLKPFPEENQKNVLDESIRESIYCNLRDEVDEITADTPYRYDEDPAEQYGFIGTFHEGKYEREKLYDSILAQKTPLTKLVSMKYVEFKPVDERGHCLRELLDTESNYIQNALSMIIENFYNKLRFQLPTGDLETIFINIKDIFQVHKRFLAKLAPAVLCALGIDDADVVAAAAADSLEDKENLQIADVFLMFKLQFIPYAQYCSLLKASTCRIDEIERTRPEIRRYISELSKLANQSQFKLRDLLVIPMQRILKYPLLLKELIRTSSDISEQTRLDAAFEAMKDISNYINEMKRDHEKIEVINTVQRSVVSCETQLNVPFTEYGRLLQDGAAKLVDDEGSTRSKQRYIFLFEKVLMVCKQKGGFYEFRRAYILSDYELMENEQEAPSKNNTISRKLTSSFFDNTSVTLVRRGHTSLICNNSSSVNNNNNNNNNSGNNNHKFGTINSTMDGFSTLSSINTLAASFVQLIFKTIQQRNDWRKELKLSIDINNPPLAIEKGHLLLYKTYTCAITCSICRKLLAGKFYQGYHCSGCNYDMHFGCCHLQRCVVRRPPLPVSSSSSLSGRRARSNSSVNFFSTNQFQVGDLVVATNRMMPTSNEPNRLSCNAGDLIEIVEVNTDGTLVGRISNFAGKIGIISSDCIARTSETLRKSVERSRHSSNCFELIGDSQSQQQQQVVLPPSLVSKAIIALSEEEGISELSEQPWFFGDLEREKATQLLERTENGTFLVRYSRQQQKYVISLKCSGREKHMKIEYCQDSGKYYLHDARFFDTIINLVHFYRHNNLSEGFNNLDAVLCGTPLKGNTYRVLQSYERRGDEKYLTLQAGDIVTVLETCGEQKGWWKGSIKGKVGFFPISFVRRISDPNTMEGYSYTLTPNGVRQTRQPLLSSSPLPTEFRASSSSTLIPAIPSQTTSAMNRLSFCDETIPITLQRHQQHQSQENPNNSNNDSNNNNNNGTSSINQGICGSSSIV